MAQQKRDLEKSLGKFYARTLQCSYLFQENQSLYPFITPKTVSYFDHLIPRDQIFEEDMDSTRINFVKKVSSEENLPKLNDEEDENETGTGIQTHMNKKIPEEEKWELIDNPYLKPVKVFIKRCRCPTN